MLSCKLVFQRYPCFRKRGSAPVYQAVWADNRDFDKVNCLFGLVFVLILVLVFAFRI